MTNDQIRQKLSDKSLKITPQRVAILDAIYKLDNHPTAEDITNYLKKNQPNIAVGTIYKVLEVLVDNGIIKKVTTEADKMRYDGRVDHHHHLYCVECDLIEDYQDDELNELLDAYFAKKSIDGFKIKDYVLQVNGTFNKC